MAKDSTPLKLGERIGMMMGMLAGHRRYAHFTALRRDAVTAQALGMNEVISEDALRRALDRIDEAASTAWMRSAQMHSFVFRVSHPELSGDAISYKYLQLISFQSLPSAAMSQPMH